MTDDIEKLIKEHAITNGFCRLFLHHTTAGITTADLDPENDLDILGAIEIVAPSGKFQHIEHLLKLPPHIVATFLGSNIFVPVKDGKLYLGKWQRVVLVELNGPRSRDIVVSFSLEGT